MNSTTIREKSMSVDSEETRKMRILSKYKDLNNELTIMREMITPQDIQKKCICLQDQLDSCNYLAEEAFELDSNKLVEHDAEFMLNASLPINIVVQSLLVDNHIFSFKEFAQKLFSHIDIYSDAELGEISSDVSDDDSLQPGPSRGRGTSSNLRSTKHDSNLASFERLGRESAYLFYSSPPFKFINGSFDPGSVTIPTKKQRRTNKRFEESSAALMKPNSSKGVAPTEDLKNGQEVERMFNKICDMASETDANSVPFSKAVIDPKSFGQTVENIFYSSFLLKEGVITIKEEHGRVVIEPSDESEPSLNESSPENAKPQNKQSFLTFSMSDYEKWIGSTQQESGDEG